MSARLPGEWELFRGDDLPIAIRLEDSPGVARDLTGWTGKATLYQRGTQVSEAEATITADEGRAFANFDEATTRNLTPGSPADARMRLTSPDGVTKTYLQVSYRVV